MKQIFDLRRKRTFVEAIVFWLLLWLIGAIVAYAIGAIEYKLFGGHKYRHILSGGSFVALIEIWVVAMVILGIKNIYTNIKGVGTLVLSVLLLFTLGGMFGLLSIALLTMFEPYAKGRGSKIVIAGTVVMLLIPSLLLVYDYKHVGITSYVLHGIKESIKQDIKNPDAWLQRNETDKARQAFAVARRDRSNKKEIAQTGYEFAAVLAKYTRWGWADTVVKEIDTSYLSKKQMALVDEIKAVQAKRDKMYNGSLAYYAANIDRGYANTEDKAAMWARKSGNYKKSVQHMMNAYETMGGNWSLTAHYLSEDFKSLGQYKDAIYVLEDVLYRLNNDTAKNNYQNKINELMPLVTNNPKDGLYQERYEKFKRYRDQYKSARKIDIKSDPEKAEEEILKALHMSLTVVDEVRSRIYLTYVYHVSGQYDKAVEQIELLRPDVSKVNDRMDKYLDGFVWRIEEDRKKPLKANQ